MTCSFVPALVDDDDSDPADDNDPSVQDDTILNGLDQHVPPAPQAPPAILAPPPPLDILDFLHRTSSYDLQSVFQLAEKLPSVPVHVPSQRAGGEARRQQLKQRAAKDYEAARAQCGAHLLFNAFWTVSHCCIHALLMRDGMHQIDLGVIIRLIMAILRKYWECVLQFLGEGQEGLAAKKLEARFKKVLDRRTGQDKQS